MSQHHGKTAGPICTKFCIEFRFGPLMFFISLNGVIIVKMSSSIKTSNLFFSTLTDFLRGKSHTLQIKISHLKTFKSYGKFSFIFLFF